MSHYLITISTCLCICNTTCICTYCALYHVKWMSNKLSRVVRVQLFCLFFEIPKMCLFLCVFGTISALFFKLPLTPLKLIDCMHIPCGRLNPSHVLKTKLKCFTPICISGLDACSNHQCQFGGMCVPTPGTCLDYTCQCPECFTGSFCETRKSQMCNVLIWMLSTRQASADDKSKM